MWRARPRLHGSASPSARPATAHWLPHTATALAQPLWPCATLQSAASAGAGAWPIAPRAAFSVTAAAVASSSATESGRRPLSAAAIARIRSGEVRARARETLEQMLELHKEGHFEAVIRRYERHEASKLGETPLPPFQNQEQLDMTNDFKPFRVYLSALIKAKPAQAQVAFDTWCTAHGFSSRFSDLYDMMIADCVRRGDLSAATALLARLREARIWAQLSANTSGDLLRAYLKSGDAATACAVYQQVGLAHPTPFGMLTELFSMFAHWDYVCVCADLHSDLLRMRWDPPAWLSGQLRDMLLDLRRHLRGEALQPDRWTPQLIAVDPRIASLEFVQEALLELGVGDDDNPVVASATAAKSTSKPAILSSPSSSPPSVASPLAFNSTHAASRLQQLLLSGSATALHFERAIKHADPQSTAEIWQLLESAQPAGSPSISQADDSGLHRPNEHHQAAQAVSGPIAPTQSLYNLVIQSLCAAGQATERRHGALAFRLFRRMVQQGFHCTMLTYKRLSIALSGGGAPASSGMDAVWVQHQHDAEAMRGGGGGWPGAPSHAAGHPERAVFRLQIEVCESMLFALASSSGDRTAPAQARQVVLTMEENGLRQNATTLGSQLLLAIYQQDEPEAHRIWTQMQEQGFSPSVSVVLKLLHLYAHIRPAGWRKRVSAFELLRVQKSIPFIQSVCAAAEARGALSPQMCEALIVALARARAVGQKDAELEPCLDGQEEQGRSRPQQDAQQSRPLPPPSPPAVQLQLQMDLLRAFQRSVSLGFVLSKHAYLSVLCAGQEVLAAQVARRKAELAAQTKGPRLAQKRASSIDASVDLDIDVSALTAELLGAMDRGGYCPPPQLLLDAFRHRVRALPVDGASGTTELLGLLNRFLLLAQEGRFVQQGFLASSGEAERLDRSDATSAQFALALERFAPAALRSLVYGSMVRAHIASTACTVAEVQTQKRGARNPDSAAASSGNGRLTPVEATLLLDPAPSPAQSSTPMLRTGTHPEDRIEPYCSFDDAAGKSASSLAAPPTARLLVLTTLNHMMLSVLARDSAASTEQQRSAQFDAAISTLLEALWEGARLYDVHAQLFTDPLRLQLTSALLRLQHPHVSDIALRFARTLGVSETSTNNRLAEVATATVLVESLRALLRQRRPLSQFDELLLRVEQLPEKMVNRMTRTAHFYSSLFVAFGLRGHHVKIMAYFHSIMDDDKPVLDSATACVLVEALDRCNQSSSLDEVVVALESIASRSTSKAPFGPDLLSALVRAYTHQDAFAHAAAENAFRPSASGPGTMARAVQLLELPMVRSMSSPALLLRMLKCALVVDDQPSAERVLRHLVQHAAAAAAEPAPDDDAPLSAMDQSALASEAPVDNDWPCSAVWHEAGAALPPFLFQAPAAAPAVGETEAAALEQLQAQCEPIRALASSDDLSAAMSALRQLARDIDAAEAAHAASAGAANVFSASRAPSVLWTLRQLQDATLGTVARLLTKQALASHAQ